jgi:hypothetical protein
MFGAA